MNTLIKAIFLFGGLLFSLIILFIDNYYILGSILLIDIFLLTFFRIKLSSIKYFTVFILVMFLLNYLLTSFNNALLVLLRLLIMYLNVNLLSNRIGTNNIAYLFGCAFHSRDLYLIISLAISFIPIMLSELLDIKKGLIAKGYPINIKNFFKCPKVFIVTFINNLLIRVNELEKVIIAKDY